MSGAPAVEQTKQRVQSNAAKCTLFIARKGRFCTSLRTVGSEYCMLHRQTLEPANELEERVVCPLSNGRHTVRKTQLDHHLQVCSDRAKDPSRLSFFAADVNLRPSPQCDEIPASSDSLRRDDELGEQQSGSSGPTTVTHFKQLSLSAFERFVQHLGEIRAKYEPVLRVVDHTAECAGLDEYLRTYRAKHTAQHAALLHQIRSCLPPHCDLSSVAFLELGAGKGGLALAVKHASPRSRVVVADQTLFRDMLDKVTTKRRSEEEERRSCAAPPCFDPPIERVMMNVKDFAFGRFIAAGSHVDDAARGWMVIGKHLCGACTDFAVHCALAPDSPRLFGIVIATCCHHLCSWDTFSGRRGESADALRGIFPSQEHFECARSVSSWGTGGESVDSGKRRIGRLAKFAIDAARVVALQGTRRFSSVRLVEYADEILTGENTALVAVAAESL